MIGDGRDSGWRRCLRRVGTVLGIGRRPLGDDANRLAGNPGDEVSWVDPAGLAERLGCAAAPLVIDVRGAAEFDGDLGHLADALNIALPELPSRLAALTGYRDRDLILVCHTQMRSVQAARLLDRAGFRKVTVLRGGMVEWRRQGLPVAAPPTRWRS